LLNIFKIRIELNADRKYSKTHILEYLIVEGKIILGCKTYVKGI
jgi:hypothetical protein